MLCCFGYYYLMYCLYCFVLYCFAVCLLFVSLAFIITCHAFTLTAHFSSQLIEEREKFFKPTENPDSTKDPFKTLFVGRLAFVTDEIKLKREFEE